MGGVKAVLFDLDGLLLDTEVLYTEVQSQIVQRFGKTFTWELKSKMMGKTAKESAEVLVHELGLAGKLDPEEFVSEREKMLSAMFPDSELKDGAERLIRHLHASKIPMAVATSTHHHHFKLKTTKHRALFDLIPVVITGDMVEQGKPHPEIFLRAGKEALGEATFNPESCLVFEDAPLGIEAANRAGMQSVLVPDPNLSLEGIPTPTRFMRSLEDFVPTEWGLPPFA